MAPVPNDKYVLQAGFPPKVIDKLGLTVEDAKLCKAAITQKLVA